jgi:predicted SAM-dependent methyltransferase
MKIEKERGMGDGEIKLNLGCELNTPAGWVNIDGSWGAWLAKHPYWRRLLKPLKVFPDHVLSKPWPGDVLVHDLRRPLPFADGSVAVVYSSHLLEHLYLAEAKNLLRESYRVLRPGGVIRMVVPDLRALVEEYCDQEVQGGPELVPELKAADRLNTRMMLREEGPPAGSLIYKIYSLLTDFHSHKWMYDAESLVWHLQQAGFTEVAALPVHESRITDIRKVEMAERVVDGAGICAEGIKPVC